MNKSDRTIRKFNPGIYQTDEEVIKQFVVRKHELNIVLEVLRGNIDSPSCQHVLVVAPRGRGKTMLLARIAAELNTDDGLSECLLPVRFMEESHEILNIADFWLETLFHLARESAKHDPVLAQELRETHTDLIDRWRERELADRVLATVLDAADRLGKKLVLMVENLQSLYENVDDDFGWQLRGALQTEPQIMLFATATSRFKGLDDAEEPFFEAFRFINLKPLTTVECHRLWQVVSGDAVTEREIRPLEILTGGNPRLLVIVSGFAQHRSLNQLLEELVTLIDDHTEYFRSHLEVLASVERRVYLALLDLWAPSKEPSSAGEIAARARMDVPSAGEIAARARMDVRITSTMLRRLVNREMVTFKGTGRKRWYEAAEILYKYYYKLRRERDEAAVVANLIHFMVVFYSKAELAEMSDKLIVEAAESKVIHEGFERAIAEQPQVGSVFSKIVRPSIDQTSNLAMSIDIESIKKLFEEILKAFDAKAFEKVIETMDQAFADWSANGSQELEPFIALAFICKALAHEQLGEFAAANAACDKVIARFGDSDVPPLQVLTALAFYTRGNAQVKLDEFTSALLSYDEVVTRYGDSDAIDLQERVAWALSKKGDVQEEQGEFTSALLSYNEVVTRFGDSEVSLLQEHVALTLSCMGLIQKRLGEYVLAIASYDEVVTRFGDSEVSGLQKRVALALDFKGMAQIQMGRAKEALHTCEEIERRLGALTGNDKIKFTWRVRCVRVLALMVQKKRRAAVDAFRSAYAVFVPDNKTVMHKMLHFVPELIAQGFSERDLIEVLSSDREKADALVPLIVALLQRAGEVVRAPVEVLEVAKDINKDIEARMAN